MYLAKMPGLLSIISRRMICDSPVSIILGRA